MFVSKMHNTKGLSYALKLLHAFWHFSFLPETFSKSELKSYVTELLFENLETNFKCYNKKHFFTEKHNDLNKFTIR